MDAARAQNDAPPETEIRDSPPHSRKHDTNLARFIADCDIQEAELHTRSSRGQRNRVHPKNWGYTTYLDRVFKMACFFDLVRLRVFPDAKDISESYGALSAACRHCSIVENAEKASGVLCLAVGDGSTPRTAGLAAFITQWTCVSIDPVLRSEWVGKDPKEVRSLFGYAGTLEDWVSEKLEEVAISVGRDVGLKHLMVLCVHSHNRFVESASMDNIREKLGFPPTTLVSLPCCHLSNPHLDLGRPADISFEDLAIFSMCRTINIWVWDAGLAAENVASGLAKSIALPVECKRKPRIDKNLLDWQAAHQKKPMASVTLASSDDGRLGYVAQVKALQRESPEQNRQWCAFADDHLGGVRDPAKHEDDALKPFIDSLRHIDGCETRPA